jgi:hypothetical protein
VAKIAQRFGDRASPDTHFEYGMRTDPRSEVSGETSAAHKTTPLRVVASC